MKLSRLVLSILFFLLLWSITSCETEESVAPVIPKSTQISSPAELILSRHLLTHFGSQAVYYNEYNQVKMVVYNAQYTAKYERYAANGNKYVKATLYSLGQAIREEVYTLNAQNKAVALTTKHLQFGGSVAKTNKYLYVYNGSGKLIRLYNQDQPKEQTKFTYNGAGNLQQVDYYKASGASLKTITYAYTNEYHDQEKEDQYHFNPELDNLDFHLRIFGTFNKHLATKELVNHQDPTQADPNVSFKYNFNPDGYPYLREKHWSNGSMQPDYYHFKKVFVGMD